MNRREFLKAAGAGTALVLAGGFGLTACLPKSVTDGVETLGNQCLGRSLVESTQAALKPFIGNPADNAWPTAMYSANTAQIASDYDSGDTVWVEGREYSRTEARLAAHWALRPK